MFLALLRGHAGTHTKLLVAGSQLDTALPSIHLVRLVWQVPDNNALNIQGSLVTSHYQMKAGVTSKSDIQETLMVEAKRCL